MRRIATVDSLYHDPTVETEGTIVPASALNDFQEELAKAVETERALDSADQGQLAKVLTSMKHNARYWAFFGGGQ